MDSLDGNELESWRFNDCIKCFIKKITHRMPVVVPSGWGTMDRLIKDDYRIKGFTQMMMGWSPNGWLVKKLIKDILNK